MDPSTSAYQALALTALSGGVRPGCCIPSGHSSQLRRKTPHKAEGGRLYQDTLQGSAQRLPPDKQGKKAPAHRQPGAVSLFIWAATQTRTAREAIIPRRLRLQQASIVYAMLLHAGVTVFRDEKPPLFQPGNQECHRLPLPVFYSSREIKELGAEAVKINNSRTMGILFAPKCIYAVFYTGDSLMKWEYRTELKVKTMLNYHISHGVLNREHISPCYPPDTPIKALLIGTDMDTSLKLLTSTGGFQKSYFYLDTKF